MIVATFLFKENAALGYNYRHISINEALALLVQQGYGDIGILDAGFQRDAKDARSWIWRRSLQTLASYCLRLMILTLMLLFLGPLFEPSPPTL